MNISDPIADMLTRVRNASRARHTEVIVPASPTKREIARNLMEEGVIADGTEERRLSRYGARPSWSPNGQEIAFEEASDIYVMNADGSAQRNLTRGCPRESQPVWAP